MTAAREKMAPAVDYLVAEYGLNDAAATEQIEFTAEMEERVPEIHSALGDSYAGAWVDNSMPGILFVASTEPNNAAGALQALDIVATIHGTKYSQRELNSGSDRLVSLLGNSYPDTSENDGGFMIAIDIQEGDLDLTLAPYYPETPELASAIANFEPQVDVQPAESWLPFEEDDCPSRSDCWPNLRAGIVIEGQNSLCTTGYTMRKDGIRYISTAGHCGGTPWEHHNINIGPTVWTQDEDRVDAKVVDITNLSFWNGRAWVFRPGNHAVEVTSKINIPDNALEGITLCLSAVVSGQHCGELLDYSIAEDNNHHQGLVDNVDACLGDSGGPWFNKFTDKAYGMHVDSSEGCGGDGRSYFTWTAWFEEESGYRVAFVND